MQGAACLLQGPTSVLQGPKIVGPIPLRSFMFTPANVFGHEIDGTQPDATQDNCYKDVSATHARNPFSNRGISTTTVSGRRPLYTIHQVARLGA
jgi:hypothetical protein